MFSYKFCILREQREGEVEKKTVNSEQCQTHFMYLLQIDWIFNWALTIFFFQFTIKLNFDTYMRAGQHTHTHITCINNVQCTTLYINHRMYALFHLPLSISF